MAAEPTRAGDRIAAGVLYRRIPNWENYYKLQAQPPRPTGLALEPDSEDEHTSMWLASMVTPDEVLQGFDGFGVCQVRAEDFPDGVYGIYEPDDGGKGHVGVRGLKGRTNRHEKIRRQLALAAEVIREPVAPLLTRDRRR